MKICAYDGCDKPHKARGFCSGHYWQLRKRGCEGKLTALKQWNRRGTLCLFGGCDKRHYANGLCVGHYGQFRKRGHKDKLTPLKSTGLNTTCLFKGCDRRSKAKGFCGAHYEQLKRKGSVSRLTTLRTSDVSYRICSFNGCTSIVMAKGFCSAHYSQLKSRGDEAALTPIYEWRYKPICSFEGCDRPHKSKGFCDAHSDQLRARGLKEKLTPLFQHIRRVGALRATHSGGYIEIKAGIAYTYGGVDKHGWKLHHRYVMEQHLERRLHREEIVHHVNGDRTDNSIENLELCSPFQPPGQRIKDKLRWARELIACYEIEEDKFCGQQ